MRYTGKIIVLAFPDTFVKMSDELMCKILPLVGLGTRTHIKAGHAALVLIENNTGKAQYFDFGRYITPKGKGRVRGANTDVELEMPLKAQVHQDKLENLPEILRWLDAHPEKTHGSGRLVASVCDSINYEKALSYILKLQGEGSVPYKAFGKVGSNCARFVTETILASTEERAIIKYLNRNKKFTPSTIGNVEKSASQEGVYQVYKGQITPYNSTALRENLTNYFDKRVPPSINASENKLEIPKNAQFLDGTGSGAWFQLVSALGNEAIVRRYTETGELDFEGTTLLPESFSMNLEYKFVYDSNCLFCTVEQDGVQFRLDLIRKESAEEFNLKQKVHSA